MLINHELNALKLNNILAATDLSAPARHAIERAALISKDTAAALDLLHVANLAPLERLRQLMGATPADMEQRVLNAARQKLRDLATATIWRLGWHPCNHRFLAGRIGQEG
jgi:nucleotide-binding universal stress UspA family protein